MRMSILVAALLATANVLLAESWPTYRHDSRRSGVTSARLEFPLRQNWTRQSKQRPQTAWTGPAKWDAYTTNSGLQSMRNFDPCFFVTASDGRVFFGSSVDDAVHALDASTGKEHWVHFTGAAVRFPPTIDGGHAYFGSDDGNVYCCDARTGELGWKCQASPQDSRVTSNRKIISMWPVRTGVVVQNDKAIFAGSLVPWQPSYLLQVNAKTGEIEDDGFRREVAGVTLQGALLASKSKIYVPQGRSAPLAFDRADGNPLGAIGEAGGVFCVLTDDEMLLAGPPNQKSTSDQIRVADVDSRRHIATFSGTNRILVEGELAWIPTNDKLKMLDRSVYVTAQLAAAKAKSIVNNKKLNDDAAKSAAKTELQKASDLQASAWRWQTDCPSPSGFAKSANAIIVGLSDEVRAYSADEGDLIWSAKVDGVAHGIAIADGQLFVSTGLGHIYAFGPKK